MALSFVLSINQLNAQESLDILPSWRIYPDAKNALYYHTVDQALRHLDERKAKVAAIETLDEWKEYQAQAIKKLEDAVGPFPEKTPLKARKTGTVRKDTYTIEHIVFESRPGFHVTSSLFLPKVSGKQKKLPAIIYCSGHTPLSYRSSTYQHVILNLVKKGFIVFAIDPVGQGERMQYYIPETGQSEFARPVHEHSYPGAQMFITGASLANYMIWDGIRAVDYLLTRKEVDGERIGITGRSGGGTQSSHISALDPRIYASAPENFITNYKRLLQSRGPQDAEQFLSKEIALGLDQSDYLIVRAPKPALMITTTNDMFSIQGAMETRDEVSGAYSAYGMGDNFVMIEDLAEHASTKKNREAMYAFFQQHLRNPGSAVDEEVELLTPGELRVTDTGQLLTSEKGETLYSLNNKRSEHLAASIRENRVNSKDAVESAKKLSGFVPPQEKHQAIYVGRSEQRGYMLDRYILSSEGRYPIPFVLLTPDKANGKAILYLDNEGKASVSRDSILVSEWIDQGYAVLAPDLIGTGEMGPIRFHGNSIFAGVSYNVWFTTILLNRSIVGIRTGDVIRLLDFLQEKVKPQQIIGISNGNMSAEMLHAAAFDSRIHHVALIDPLLSYLPVVQNGFYDPNIIHHVVPSALTRYDLPDLAGSLTDRKLLLLIDEPPANISPANLAEAVKYGTIKHTEDCLEYIKSSFNRSNKSGNLKMVKKANSGLVKQELDGWLSGPE